MKVSNLYAELELITPELEQQLLRSHPPTSRLTQISRYCSQAIQSWINYLVKSPEPKITQRFDSQGNPFFEIYDPVSRQVLQCQSESEVRSWLEQRYYLS